MKEAATGCGMLLSTLAELAETDLFSIPALNGSVSLYLSCLTIFCKAQTGDNRSSMVISLGK